MTNLASRAGSGRRWLFVLAALAVAALLAWWLWPSGGGEGAGNRPGAPGGRPGFGAFGGPVPVRVEAVRQGDFPVYHKALGTVTPLNTVSVRSRVGGELMEVLFEEGQRVDAGQLLAIIDPRPYRVALQQAEGALAQSRAQLRNAKVDLERYKGLYAEDSIAKQTLDTQQALVAQYEGTVATNQAAVNEARLNLEFTQIKSPIAGRLGLRQLDVGNLVTANAETPLVVITQTQPMAIAFTLPEADLPLVVSRFRQGNPLGVQAWDRGERVLYGEGVLESLDNQIDTATGTLRFKARFDNEAEMLIPNQFVNIRLRAQVLEGATLAPSAAVQFGTRGTFVYVVKEDNKVELRSITTGPSDGAVTVVEDGLAPGERVVLEGTDRLRDGAEVEVVDNLATDETAADNPVVGGKSGERPAR
ncbi:MdtA/MuxA family multidrug efflux RND transporter periplasmic adaptor subunit [Stutzerimonas azotifigens]|uniref:MdtA/MuxA family multidrug efflux RND transporter periplasmic adaptor subunit n=1 Tax=Stutzerimonas azotifigens TaxID=291995 RepID=UPI00048469F8|nr:MdtA/MuxA family multidrug efflux RND transporter periplasmic adaptor subunit [Stutzerimonas azotifigens]